MNLRRLAGWALIVGTTVATAGYAASRLLAPGGGDAVYRNQLFPLFQGIALVGDVVIALGLPVILTFASRALKLHLVGFVGVFTALLMLNLGEGTIEAFVKPYLAHHGGIPMQDPSGLVAFEAIALVALVAGSVCLGIAVLRARSLPWWIGATLIVSGLGGALGLPGAWFLLPDTLFYASLFAVGTFAVRGAQAPLRGPARQAAVTASAGPR